MNKIEQKFKEIRQFCKQHANPEIEKKYAKFFTEGYDAYGVETKTFVAQRDKWLKEWEDEFSIEDYLSLGDKLISTGKYEEASYAMSFLYNMTDKFTPEMFERFGQWLEKGIVNWGHTDNLSGQVLGYFFTSKMLEIEELKKWTTSGSIWKKRAVPVTLIEILKTDIEIKRIFAIIDPLMMDEAKKVQQGLGWLLREMWKIHQKPTEKFLMKWKETCGRTIIQYATEKMSKEERLKYRRTKKK